MKPTMFVVITTLRFRDLRSLYHSLARQGHDVKAYSPGSLGQVVPNTDSWILGSVGVKLSGVSVLAFANGKVKLSGGCVGYQPPECVKTWLYEHRIRPVCEELQCDPPEAYSLSLLNGYHRLEHVRLETFHTIMQTWTSDFVVKPPTMYNNPTKRGRICSVGVRVKGIHGSLRFDHTGKMQMFGFRSYEDMENAVQFLESHLKNTMTK